MKDKIFKNRIIILIIAALVIFIILLIVSIKKLTQGETIMTTILFAPEGVKITIDNNIVENNKETPLTPGEHTLTVSKPGYETISQKTTISKLHNKIYGALKPNNTSEDDYTHIYDSFFGEIIQEEEEKITSLYPIYKYLPNNNSSQYSIDYTMNDDYTDFKVIATIKDKRYYSDVNSVVSILKNINQSSEEPFDLTPYNIIIDNYKSNLIATTTSTANDPETYIREVFSDYIIDVLPGNVKDDYYYTIIKEYNPYNKTDYMSLRIILRRNNNSWSILTQPQPILTIFNTNNISNDILNEVNNYNPINIQKER